MSILLMHNIVVVSNIVTWCNHISHAIRNCGSAVTSIRYQIWIILSTQNLQNRDASDKILMIQVLTTNMS